MKQRKIVKIDDKEITIKELTLKELLYLCHKTGWIGEVSGIDFEKDFAKQESMELLDLILDFASDLSRGEAVVLAPSEMKVLYDVFVKINETTFSMAKYFGIGKILEDTKSDLIKTFMGSYSSFVENFVIAKVPNTGTIPINGSVVSEDKGHTSEK